MKAESVLCRFRARRIREPEGDRASVGAEQLVAIDVTSLMPEVTGRWSEGQLNVRGPEIEE